MLKIASWLSVLSLVCAGLLGAAVTVPLGPPLAMLAAMYGGNTLPDTPALPYPWLPAAAALAAVGAGLVLDRRGRARAGMVVAHIGAVVLALLPFVHLWRLTGLTGEAMP